MAFQETLQDITPYVSLFLLILCVYYIAEVIKGKYSLYKTSHIRLSSAEGFENPQGAKAQSETTETSDTSLYSWITDPTQLYDEFYVHIYDQLSNQVSRTHTKVGMLLGLWGQDKENAQDLNPKQWSLLDAGCGTGHACYAFAKKEVGYIVGLDISKAMIDYASQKSKDTLKSSQEEIARIRWRHDSLINPSACGAGEFSHIVCFYFSLYELQDQEQLFRHWNLWSKPGGKLCVEVVNKYKFDPILESASPFLGFSLQKYSQERIRKSKVAFDKFDYEAEFQLTDNKGEFYETFRFKQGGSVRRQKHILWMPEIKDIVEIGKRAGWKYVGSQDLNPIGFEYGYLLLFEKS